MIGTIRVGRSYTWEIECVGNPITDKMWSREFKEEVGIETAGNITIEREDYISTFKIVNAQRKAREPEPSFDFHADLLTKTLRNIRASKSIDRQNLRCSNA